MSCSRLYIAAALLFLVTYIHLFMPVLYEQLRPEIQSVVTEQSIEPLELTETVAVRLGLD